MITRPRGSAPGLLWERFAAVIGVDPASADLSTARAHRSLGLAEVEVLTEASRPRRTRS